MQGIKVILTVQILYRRYNPIFLVCISSLLFIPGRKDGFLLKPEFPDLSQTLNMIWNTFYPIKGE